MELQLGQQRTPQLLHFLGSSPSNLQCLLRRILSDRSIRREVRAQGMHPAVDEARCLLDSEECCQHNKETCKACSDFCSIWSTRNSSNSSSSKETERPWRGDPGASGSLTPSPLCYSLRDRPLYIPLGLFFCFSLSSPPLQVFHLRVKAKVLVRLISPY